VHRLNSRTPYSLKGTSSTKQLLTGNFQARYLLARPVSCATKSWLAFGKCKGHLSRYNGTLLYLFLFFGLTNRTNPCKSLYLSISQWKDLLFNHSICLLWLFLNLFFRILYLFTSGLPGHVHEVHIWQEYVGETLSSCYSPTCCSILDHVGTHRFMKLIEI
jgi:hypothetical protein